MRRILLVLVFLGRLSAFDSIGQEGDTINDTNIISNQSLVDSALPFELDGGIILVEGVLDGVAKTFILDSGAPSLILNCKSKKGKPSSLESVNGTIVAYEKSVKQFEWANTVYKDVEALCVDLSYLERLTGRKIGGLIGYDLLKKYELFLDYEALTLVLKKDNLTNEQKDKPVVSFPLSFVNHIPTLEVEIAGEKLMLGIDTGAEVNVLDENLSGKISPASKKKKEKSKIITGRRQKQKNNIVEIDVTKLDKASYLQMDYVLMNLGGEQRQQENKDKEGELITRVDGVLGYPFLSSCKFSINYGENTLNLWR